MKCLTVSLVNGIALYHTILIFYIKIYYNVIRFQRLIRDLLVKITDLNFCLIFTHGIV